MTWPNVKFVDAPATTAAVRLDMSTPAVQVHRDEFTLGVPTYDGDPESTGVEYSYRSMSLDVIVTGTKAFATGVLQTLARELMRPTNWLLFQLQATSTPVWFRTWRGQPGELSLGDVYDESSGVKLPDLWRITVPLTADPFSWGARETIGPFTIQNDPASGTNRCRYAIPDTIKGDVKAPCTVDITPSVFWTQSNPLFGIVAHQTTVPPIHLWPIGGTDGWTLGADVAASTTDATYSGSNYRAVSFATQTGLVTRLSGTTPTVPEPGRYKVLLRIARSDTTSTFAAEMRMLYINAELPSNGVIAVLDRGASAAAGYACLLDLGEYVLPPGGEGWTSVETGTPLAPGIALKVQRLSGTGSARLDYLIAIPVNTTTTTEARFMTSWFRRSFISGSRNGIWDADKQMWRAMNFGFAHAGMLPPEMAGVYPVLDPGRNNVFHLHHQVGSSTEVLTEDNDDDITATASIVLTYYPRYLNLAP